MYNLFISLGLGVVTALGIRFGTPVGWIGSIVPGLLVAVGGYLVLGRRVMKGLQAVMDEAQKELQAQRFEKAIAALESGFQWSRWQFLVDAQIHSQLGVLRYVRKEFDEALPHLEKSFSRHWVARGMLACLRYKKKDLDGMRKVFEGAVKVSKKESLLWAAYAWCLDKEGLHDEAVKVIARGETANPTDDKLKSAANALRNKKKLKPGKMWGENWFQFHLEPIPPQLFGGAPGMRGGGRRVIYQRR
jgi:tetratricopeptide (TPR) repeat protein